MTEHSETCHVPFRFAALDSDAMLERARGFHELMDARRSIRDFSSRPVPRELIERAIQTASTAPSGAHRQPWRFVVVSDDKLKQQIREAVEYEERESYERRMPASWKQALKPIGTNWQKPYLTTVPWIVVVFEEIHGLEPDGQTRPNYYVKESVGIACGLFIAALHHMGLVSLTHTPSPMGFLANLLERPPNERPFMLFPIGFPAPDATVPDLVRKPLSEVAIWKTSDGAAEELNL